MVGDYYRLVPKDYKANLLFRERCIRAARSREVARDLWTACSRDLLFYLNTFGWLYEPRTPAVIPFITWDYQDEALLAISDAIGKHDLCIKKSRDMGATWMCLAVFAWYFHFRPMVAFGVMSRVETLVDKTDDPDCLFWKLTFFFDHQPKWLRPVYEHTELKLKNCDNGSTITGASTTGNAFRAGRKTAIFLDEFAAFNPEDSYAALYATQAVTPCRIWNSTPQGVGNAYYDVAHDPNIRQLVLPWWKHPLKKPGLYTTEKGLLEVLDQNYRFPAGYEFVRDGKLRSPWYDIECKRTPIPQLIAQEIDMDFLGSGFGFFNKAMLDRHEKEHGQPPYHVGELEYDAGTGEPREFVENPKGRLLLWTFIGPDGRPPKDEYSIGTDVSAGTGASNSCISVISKTTGEKVASYVNPQVAPHELAGLACALGHWFTNDEAHVALIVPEANGGHNRQFIKQLLDYGYGNLYYRRDETRPGARPSDVPGWAATRDNKRQVLEEYSRALSTSEFINHDVDAIRECREYVFFPDGAVEHARSRNIADPSGARDNHGDRVVADSLAWHGARGHQRKIDNPFVIPVGSFAWRRQMRMQAESRGKYW